MFPGAAKFTGTQLPDEGERGDEGKERAGDISWYPSDDYCLD